VYAHDVLLRQFQRHLLERGVPLAWTMDLPADDPLFVPTQLLVLAGAITLDSPRFYALAIELDQPLSDDEILALIRAMQQIEPTFATSDVNTVILSQLPTWRDVCLALAPLIDQSTIPLAR
jgi:hypothetical protein